MAEIAANTYPGRLQRVKDQLKNGLVGDLFGGVASALVGLPLSLACGVLLFSAIDSSLIPLGVQAAMFAAIVGCLVTAFIGSHPLQISGPRVATTLLLADFLHTLYPALSESVPSAQLPTVLWVIMALCVFLSGLWLGVFALLRLGEFIKFLPLSVTQGTNAAIGLIIIVKQWSLINADNALPAVTSWLVVAAILGLLFSKPVWMRLAQAYPKTLLHSALVLVANSLPLTAPLAGGVLFYVWVDFADPFLLGAITIQWPSVSALWGDTPQLAPLLIEHLPQMTLTALAIAGMGALNSLMSVRMLDSTQPCNNPCTRRELAGQGLGNVLSGVIGGMPSAGSEARGLSNYNAGGRTRLSALSHALVLLLGLSIASEYLAAIPGVVLAALLIHTGLTMSKPLKVMATRIGHNCKDRPWRNISECIKDILQSYLVVAVMILTSIFYSVAVAIAAGFSIAACLFIAEMTRNTHYRIVGGESLRARRQLPPEAQNVLAREGGRIQILELDGALFFGTAERVRKVIGQLLPTSEWLILDFRKVSEVDLTGASIIAQSVLASNRPGLLFSHVRKGDDSYQALCSAGLIGSEKSSWFHDTNAALEWAEDQILKPYALERRDTAGDVTCSEPIGIRSVELQAVLTPYLETRSFTSGEYLFRINEPADRLFYVFSGEVDLCISESHVGKAKQRTEKGSSSEIKLHRYSLTERMFVGESGFLCGDRYFVDAIADGPVNVGVLTRATYNLIQAQAPEIAAALSIALAQHAARRLRDVTHEVQRLEHWT